MDIFVFANCGGHIDLSWLQRLMSFTSNDYILSVFIKINQLVYEVFCQQKKKDKHMHLHEW